MRDNQEKNKNVQMDLSDNDDGSYIDSFQNNDDKDRTDFSSYGSLSNRSESKGIKHQYQDKDKNKKSDLTLRNLEKHNVQFLKDVSALERNFKVKQFNIENPVSAAFLRREKGRLPYSVFTPSAPHVKFFKSLY